MERVKLPTYQVALDITRYINLDEQEKLNDEVVRDTLLSATLHKNDINEGIVRISGLDRIIKYLYYIAVNREYFPDIREESLIKAFCIYSRRHAYRLREQAEKNTQFNTKEILTEAEVFERIHTFLLTVRNTKN